MIFILAFVAISAIEEPVTYDVIKKGLDDSQFYRIPAIVMAPDNKTLVTATDKRWLSILDLPRKIDVVIKLSHDGGRTWSVSKTITPGKADPKGYGDPALVVDRERGAIFCLITGNQGTFESTQEDMQHNYYCVSYDNGETWSDMVDITDMLFGPGCTNSETSKYFSNFFSSGNALQLRSGRLLIVGVVRRNSGRGLSTHSVYSDDHGKTWTMSPHYGTTTGDESKVVELNNGSVLMSIRHRPDRFFTISNDGGVTWGPTVSMKDLHDPACNGDLIRYTSTKDGFDKDRLIHTMLYTSNGNSTRWNLTVLVSYDEGNTWPVKKVLEPSYAIYSSITFSPIDGTLYIYWEKSIDSTVGSGCDMVCTRLTLDWITDGADHWEPPKNLR